MGSSTLSLPACFGRRHPYLDSFPHHLSVAGGVQGRVAELSRLSLTLEDQAKLKIALESAGRPRGSIQLPSLWRIL